MEIKNESLNNLEDIERKPNENQTYFNMGSTETGSIEIDLVSFRQKNQEAKYLTISIKSPNSNDETSFAIDNEDAFMALKNFFKQLDWNV
jgi:dihydroorotate dehydrogenase